MLNTKLLSSYSLVFELGVCLHEVRSWVILRVSRHSQIGISVCNLLYDVTTVLIKNLLTIDMGGLLDDFLAGATSGAMDAGNLLKPMLGRGELRCIGATTLNEYRKYIEKDPALARRFQQVFCDQPTVEDTISILRGLRERYELHHGVKISDSALVAAAVLADRYITERFLPDKGKIK